MSNAEQPAGKMWSGRFREPLDRGFEKWQRSFPFDVRLIEAEIRASRAHARMIAAAGVLTDDEETRIIEGLDEISRSGGKSAKIYNQDVLPRDLSLKVIETLGEEVFHSTVLYNTLCDEIEAEDVHHYIELRLTTLIGETALKLHTGRSRNEQIATDMRLFVRATIDNLIYHLTVWAGVLIDLAERAGEAVMPSYTHMQRAEPVLVAHWLLAYVSMAERDISRLKDARARMNFCPLGSGAVAGATLALDREIAARELGFDGPTANSMDATSDRDFLLEFTQCLAGMGVHLSRFAEEITLFSTAEFGFVELPETFSTGSSAMPQKKNPDFTELLRGKCARLVGAATTVAMLMKGLPLAYNKDLQEGQEPVFDAADTAAGVLRILPGFTRALKFDFARMRTAATTGYLNAMAAATYLTGKGVAFRKAHEKVGNAVRYALESGRELNELTLEELRQFGEEFGEDFFAAITLEATLDCHDVMGGTNRERVRIALAEARERLAKPAPAASVP